MEENLWPDISALGDFVGTPKMLLENLAEQLREKYKNILEAKVESYSGTGYFINNGFVLTFSIVAPMLNNYEYELFRVEHDLLLESIICDFATSHFSGKGIPALADLKKFIIEEIINTDSTKRILASLYYQSSNAY